MYYLYILKSLKDNKYYIGSTNDIKRRLEEHNKGQTKSTKLRTPFNLVFCQEYFSADQAKKIEKKLKSFKNKQIIDKIIKDGVIKMRS